jgi:thioredoxin 1
MSPLIATTMNAPGPTPERDPDGAPTRAEIDATRGPLVLEFGTGWCGVCAAARPLVAAARQAHPALPYRWVEDGPGRRLGRSFGVKLWPTLVFLRDGQEVARLVRPGEPQAVQQAFTGLAAG